MNLLGFNVDEWDSCRNEREWMGKWLIWGNHPPIREKGGENWEKKWENEVFVLQWMKWLSLQVFIQGISNSNNQITCT